MGTRLELQALLEELNGNDHVYFQPPESIKMVYPAFVYSLNDVRTVKADDKKYLNRHQYRVQYISRDPDNSMVDIMLDLPYCSFNGRSVIDNLYHDNFNLYF